jgi:putative flippase GtrA
MRKIFEFIGDFIRPVIDFFYPPFRKYISLQFFRYGVTGAMNLIFDWTLYFLIYQFVLQKQMVHLGFVTISSHIATFCIKFPIVLFSGFLLQKYVTFTYSELRGRIQLFRYLVVFFINLIINYLGLKLLVDYFEIWPSVSNALVSIITIFISYFSQKHYTFKISAIPGQEDFDQVYKNANQ